MSLSPDFGTTPQTIPPFDGFQRTSLYLLMADGVRLAIDLFLPTSAAAPPEAPIPAIFQMTPYNRAELADGVLTHALSPYLDAEGLQRFNNLAWLCRQGYAVCVADVRGQGASFGHFTGCMTAEEGRDGAAIVDWLATQSWCNGRVGMLGSSYGASTQFLVAAENPPALKALYAAHSFFDAYDVFFPGGVRELSLPVKWGKLVDDLAGRTAPTRVAPVDGPDGFALRDAAVCVHCAGPGSADVFECIFRDPYRDGTGYFTTRTQSGSQNLAMLLPELRDARIPAYFHGGWNDYYPGALAQWFVNWNFAPARLVIGPWTHSPRTFTSPRDDADLAIRATEAKRWFDHWLKDYDSGMLSEPAVTYAIQSGHPYVEGVVADPDEQWEWRTSRSWPLDGTKTMTFALEGMSKDSNQGVLTAAPESAPTTMSVIIDSTITTGPHNRMGSSFEGVCQNFPDMAEQDARCLTWTTAPLGDDLCIAGAPLITVTVACDAPDANLFFWLEDVDPDGRSTIITYASLKASHRAKGSPPYDPAGLVYLASTRAATDGFGSDHHPVTICTTLLPVANRFRKGHLIRLTLSGSDAANFEALAGGARLQACLDNRREAASLCLPVI
jgi:uncharacterized protein